MHAAVVEQFGQPPVWREFPEPEPAPGHVIVEVLAAGLHQRVRSQAAGSHYTSEGTLPLVPGVDGVGRFPDGTVRYFVAPEESRGTMAERVAADPRQSVVLPDGADPVAVAAGANPVMSSWVALRHRIDFAPDSRVLVLGATGASGSAAVQVAKHLGASAVVAAGRDQTRLAALRALGADSIATLGDPATVARAAGAVDVVIDYVWGRPAADVMVALVTARAEPGRTVDWITIGAAAGGEAAIPSAALRSSPLRIIGSGQGSVGRAAFLAELPGIVGAIADGVVTIDTEAAPFADVTARWDHTDVPAATRLVFVPAVR